MTSSFVSHPVWHFQVSIACAKNAGRWIFYLCKYRDIGVIVVIWSCSAKHYINVPVPWYNSVIVPPSGCTLLICAFNAYALDFHKQVIVHGSMNAGLMLEWYPTIAIITHEMMLPCSCSTLFMLSTCKKGDQMSWCCKQCIWQWTITNKLLSISKSSFFFPKQAGSGWHLAPHVSELGKL